MLKIVSLAASFAFAAALGADLFHGYIARWRLEETNLWLIRLVLLHDTDFELFVLLPLAESFMQGRRVAWVLAQVQAKVQATKYRPARSQSYCCWRRAATFTPGRRRAGFAAGTAAAGASAIWLCCTANFYVVSSYV